MNIQEKVEELIKSFIPFADVDKEGDAKWYARKCAIICVEQIIKELIHANAMEDIDGINETGKHLTRGEYWKEVLTHLNSMI